MKKKSIFWGLVLICIAVLLILEGVGSGLGIIDSIPVIKIILGVAFVAVLGNELYRLRISHIFFPLAFIFLLFEKEIAGLLSFPSSDIISNWTVLLIALLFTIGSALILPKKKSNGGSDVWIGDEKVYDKDKGFKFKVSGKTTKYIDASNFNNEHVENHMGATEVFFENTENYTGGSVLNVENHMGSMTIHIPGDWTVFESIENHMGSINKKQSATSKNSEKTINITGECHMGSITIDYV